MAFDLDNLEYNKKDTQSRSLNWVSFYRLYLEIVPNATLVFTVDTWLYIVNCINTFVRK